MENLPQGHTMFFLGFQSALEFFQIKIWQSISITITLAKTIPILRLLRLSIGTGGKFISTS